MHSFQPHTPLIITKLYEIGPKHVRAVAIFTKYPVHQVIVSFYCVLNKESVVGVQCTWYEHLTVEKLLVGNSQLKFLIY